MKESQTNEVENKPKLASNIIEVQTTVGTWEIKKPKAIVRNDAISKAEVSNGDFKQSVFMAELLPKCINKRPESFDSIVPIKQVLRDLEIEDYDTLVIAMGSLIKGTEDEEVKEEKKD